MLILTRKIGETVVIGDGIYCTVLKLSRNQVRLGVDAPKTLPVYRKEIHDRIQLEKQGVPSMKDEAHASLVDGLVANVKCGQPEPQVH